jgi:hypothetical protein
MKYEYLRIWGTKHTIESMMSKALWFQGLPHNGKKIKSLFGLAYGEIVFRTKTHQDLYMKEIGQYKAITKVIGVE